MSPNAVTACQRTVKSVLHKAPISGFMTLAAGSCRNSSMTSSILEDPSSLVMRRFSRMLISYDAENIQKINIFYRSKGTGFRKNSRFQAHKFL
jgi:hypothetical protein